MIIIGSHLLIIKSGSWGWEDVQQRNYYLEQESDKEMVEQYIIKLKNKYQGKYNYDKAQDAIEGYIIRTLKGIRIDDKGQSIYLN